MAERTPRNPEDVEYTGAGTPRTANSTGREREGGFTDPDIDPAVITGATTSSDPSDVAGLAVNRSGSGGSGYEPDDEEPPPA